MNSALRAAIVRVRHPGGAIVGGGFYVGEGRVLTCAHVVADALGLDRSEPQRPEAEVSLDFPLVPGAPTASAHVEVWRPLGPGGSNDPGHGDMAVLELLHPPPTGAQPIRRVLAGILWKRQFGAFGFPSGNDSGTYTYGHCLGPQASGWIQVESTSEYRIEGGYSGAPAWDEERGLVVGMMVASEGARTVKAGWVIPVPTLTDVCPGLDVVELAETESAVPTAGPPRAVFRAPQRNPIFTGRDQLLTDLSAALASGTRTALVHAITGLGGAGKTQIAIEYAHRHRNDYRVIWWLRAERPETLLEDLTALATPLGLTVPTDAPRPDVAATVRRELEENPGWLLVFDNADSLDAVREYLPEHGYVLITSRNPTWRAAGATVLEVDVWSPREAVTFLLTRTGRADAEGAAELAAALGYLPLALEQAAAYIEVNATSFARYVQVYEGRSGTTLLAQHGPLDYAGTVATTWRLSFDQVRKASPAAAELLELCAFLAPETIPVDLFHPEDKNLLTPRLRKADDAAFDEACGALRRYSLVQRSEGTLGLHRLVQQVIRTALPPKVFRKRVRMSVMLLCAAFPIDSYDVRTWKRCAQLLPHALAVTGHAESTAADPEARSWLLDRAGEYLHGRAELIPARQLFERALALAEVAYGPRHPMLATSVNNLAAVLRTLGDLKEARRGFERALAIAEAAYGPRHPEVAQFVNNLAAVLQELNDLEEARRGFERALAITEAAYGLDHPEVAQFVNNLAAVLQELNDPEGARRGYERAIAIYEAADKRDHPSVANVVTNLAAVLQSLGDLAGAQRSNERALTIDEAAYGPYHPMVARDVNNLARVLQELGDLIGARENFERALRIYEAVYGPHHRDVAAVLNNLAQVLHALRDLAGARQGFERALAICEATYGPNHPTVATRLNNLAMVLKDLGDLAGAQRDLKRALAIDEAAYGLDHPEVATDSCNLATLLRERGDLKGARRHLERALAIDEAAYDRNHPSVARDLTNLAMVLWDLGHRPQARRGFERALTIFTTAGGPSHPSAVLLAALLRSLH
jgi:tetratricopeptide (TPR) repeat protein